MKRKYIDYNFNVKSVNNEDGIIEGYASIFDDKDSYGDITIEGAFVDSLNKHKEEGTMPLLLWQHYSDQPIGKWINIEEDKKGLSVKGKIFKDNIQKAKEAFFLLQEKAISGLSIGYSVVKERYDDKNKINILEQVNLYEVSLVSFPALESAQVTTVKSIRDLENALRKIGLSRKEAKSVASCGFKGIKKDESNEIKEIKSIIEKTLKILS